MVKGKKKAVSRWWGDWTLLWIFGGFILAYFVYIPITVTACIPSTGYTVLWGESLATAWGYLPTPGCALLYVLSGAAGSG